MNKSSYSNKVYRSKNMQEPGFIDGTMGPFCRPGEDWEETKEMRIYAQIYLH